MKLLHLKFWMDVDLLIRICINRRQAGIRLWLLPQTTTDWEKLHSKLATISAAANIDKAGPCVLLNAQPIISELVQSTGSFLKSMISVSAR